MKRLFVISSVVACLAAAAPASSLQEAMDMYAAGDPAGAAAAYSELAHSGNSRAQFNLALMFYAGQGVPQNYSDAFVWAWRAKLQGVQQAEVLIARVADSISRDERTALADVLSAELAPKIAQGDAKAMLAMSIIQSDLLPRPDLVQTYVWQSLSVVAGLDAAATLRDETFRGLSARDQVKAQTEARVAFDNWCETATVPQPACRVIR